MVIAFLCLCPNDVVCMLLYMIYIILCHSDQFLGMGDFLFSIFFDLVCWFVGLLFVFELRVSLEAASLSLWIEARSVYIPPSPDPISSFAICGIYWVWLLFIIITDIPPATAITYISNIGP
ncbi:hypothetical protein Hanom_Chr09g00788281 [Helianthus anomalus]